MPPDQQDDNAEEGGQQGRFREESQLKLGYFEGTEDEASVRAFLQKLEGLQQAGRYSEVAVAGWVKYSVRGKARRWLDNLMRSAPNDCKSWAELQPHFVKRWLTTPTYTQIAHIRSEATQKVGVSVKDFYDIVNTCVLRSHESLKPATKASDVYPDVYQHALMQEFLGGLRPVIKSKVGPHKPKTPDEALEVAITAEKNLIGEELRTYNSKTDKQSKVVDAIISAVTEQGECDEDIAMEVVPKIVEAIRTRTGRGEGKKGKPKGRGTSQEGSAGGTAGSSRPGGQGGSSRQGGRGGGGGGMACWGCGDTTHMMRDCPTYKAYQAQRQHAQAQVRSIDYAGAAAPPPQQQQQQQPKRDDHAHPFQ